jgi:phosphoribosylformimino-5-aminoimidazole carboxamide ribotide isomerase
MPFEVIPVIDLKHGKAVRAVAGNRADYQPLATPLCTDGEALSCVRGYLTVHPFERLYIADLDAIEGGARQDEALAAIRSSFPHLDLWVDAGFASEQATADWLRLGLGRPVLGSESLQGTALPVTARCVLSLDFRGERFLGSPALLADPTRWPHEVIVMCLHDVGTGGGPDMTRLASIIALAGDRRVYAAGGLRDAADIQALARLGAAGALVASSLHSGAITSADLTV